MSSTTTPVADLDSLPLRLLHVLTIGLLSEQDGVGKFCRAAILTGGKSVARTLRRWAQQPDTSPSDRRKVEEVADTIERSGLRPPRLSGKRVTRALYMCVGASDTWLGEEATQLLAVLYPGNFADHLVDEAFTTKSPTSCERLLRAAGTSHEPLSWASRDDLQLMLRFKRVRGPAAEAALELLKMDDQRRGLAVR